MMPSFRHHPTPGCTRVLVFAWLLAWTGIVRADEPSLPAPFIPADAKSVRDDLLAARGFYVGECYTEAFECDEEVLAFDLRNAEARAGEERIRRALLERDRAEEWRHLHLPSLDGPIYRKLRGIILPKMDFHATSFTDAAEFLRREAFRLDTDPNPATRGVNVVLPPVLPLPPAPPSAPKPLYSNLDPSSGEVIPGLPTPAPAEPAVLPFPNGPRIFLYLDHRTSLLEAWRILASQANYELGVREDGLHLLRIGGGGLGLIPHMTFHLAPSRTLPRDLRPWFEAHGVAFTPFTTVNCLSRPHQLVVVGPWVDVDKVAVFLGCYVNAFR